MSLNYKRFLEILEKWPPNTMRKTRDYGFVLRKRVNQTMETGNPFVGTTEENARKLESLWRITENTYGKKFPCNVKVGATGLTLRDLNKCLDDDAIKKFNRMHMKLF